LALPESRLHWQLEHPAMPFSNGSYSPEQLKLMATALDAAWQARPSTGENDFLRMAMASRIMAAVDAGERDPERLMLGALAVTR
jgi:hypothetical protein